MYVDDIEGLIKSCANLIDLGINLDGIRFSLKSKGCREEDMFLIYSAAKLLSQDRE